MELSKPPSGGSGAASHAVTGHHHCDLRLATCDLRKTTAPSCCCLCLSVISPCSMSIDLTPGLCGAYTQQVHPGGLSTIQPSCALEEPRFCRVWCVCVVCVCGILAGKINVFTRLGGLATMTITSPQPSRKEGAILIFFYAAAAAAASMTCVPAALHVTGRCARERDSCVSGENATARKHSTHTYTANT